MKEIRNILAINFGGIGDEILFLPALISLKKEFPQAKIALALEPRSKGIKDLTDIIDELFLIDLKFKNKYFELLKLIFLAKKGEFDLVISSGTNKFISILLFLTGIKRRYGYNTGILSEKLLTGAIPLNKNQYAAKMYHDLVSQVTDIKTEMPEINIKSDKKEANTILIHPGVSKLSVKTGMIKTISPQKWAKVIDLLLKSGKKVILAGGPDDKECITQIKNTGNNFENPNFVNANGQTKNLPDLAKLIASCEKFLCSDSAPLHIAAALRVKTYAIFGPTDDKTLIPQTPLIIPVKASDNCALKPCLKQKRRNACRELFCLDILPEDIVQKVLSD